jgi:transketolase
VIDTTLEEAPELIGKGSGSMREAFGHALVELAGERDDLVVLDADIAGGTGVHNFRDAHPERFFQFGIAEQNMMAVAGGMASLGLLPVVTTFAVFCLRAVEQARLSIAYSQRKVVIAASHPGLDVGPDGGSAQCFEDMAAYRAIPGMTVLSPADPIEMRLATRAAIACDGPVYMRTGRSPIDDIFDASHTFEIGRGHKLTQGSDVTIVACGVEVARALEAAEALKADGISASVVNLASIQPVDHELLAECARSTRAFVTAEDHSIRGGLGSAVAESLASHLPRPIEFVGHSDEFGTSGEPDELAERYGIDSRGIAAAARRVLSRSSL